MNNRIKALYQQASEQARKQACEKNKTSQPQLNTIWNEFVPLFAELIIKECADAADMAHEADCIYPGDYIVEHMECHGDLGAAVWRSKQ